MWAFGHHANDKDLEMSIAAIVSAYRVLDSAVMDYPGEPLGTVTDNQAAHPAAESCLECCVRDFRDAER